MTSVSSLPSLEETIHFHGLGTKKALGQHFLLDAVLLDKIVQGAGKLEGQSVIEVGPGPGGLTRSILAGNPKEVFALEMDSRCVAALRALESASGDTLRVIEGDATRINIADIGTSPRIIIANLPYNVGTELLMGWLSLPYLDPSAIRCMILMFQKEVAERILAVPSSSHYGRLSIITQWLCEAYPLMVVPPSAFSPPPKVESMVVQLVPRSAPLYPAPKEKLEKVIAIAFQQRRKMLRKALKSLGDPLLVQIEDLHELRPDQIGLKDYVRIANLLAD